MNILTIGDIFGKCGVEHVKMVLRGIKEDENIDFCIANAENASGLGISVREYDELDDAGVDAFTLGNHTFGKKDVLWLFDNKYNIIRPANYPEDAPGKGSVVLRCKDRKLGIINLMGRVEMGLSLDCPFKTFDREYEKIKKECDLVIVDFHAEATSEKKAMMYYVNSRANALFGTHTHIQTADEKVTSSGMGYITDLGITGAIDSVLGVEKDIILQRFLTSVPCKFEYSSGRAELCGAVFSFDDNTGRCTGVKRLQIK